VLTRRLLNNGLWLALLLLAGVATMCAPAAKELPRGKDAVWDLVVIGDSSMWEMGAGMVEKIQADTGVKVVLHDFTLPALSAGSVLKVLETGKSPNMRLEPLPEAVKEAEIVVMFTNPEDSIDADHPLDLYGCFGCSAPGNCESQSYTLYQQHLEAIWARVIELRKGQATVMVATDIYNPLVEHWNSCSIFDACDQCWQGMSEAARKAAEAYNIPFLSRYDEFNGPDHSAILPNMGLIRPDGEHPTQRAGQVFGEMVVKMGYQPVQVNSK